MQNLKFWFTQHSKKQKESFFHFEKFLFSTDNLSLKFTLWKKKSKQKPKFVKYPLSKFNNIKTYFYVVVVVFLSSCVFLFLHSI